MVLPSILPLMKASSPMPDSIIFPNGGVVLRRVRVASPRSRLWRSTVSPHPYQLGPKDALPFWRE